MVDRGRRNRAASPARLPPVRRVAQAPAREAAICFGFLTEPTRRRGVASGDGGSRREEYQSHSGGHWSRAGGHLIPARSVADPLPLLDPLLRWPAELSMTGARYGYSLVATGRR